MARVVDRAVDQDDVADGESGVLLILARWQHSERFLFCFTSPSVIRLRCIRRTKSGNLTLAVDWQTHHSASGHSKLINRAMNEVLGMDSPGEGSEQSGGEQR